MTKNEALSLEAHWNEMRASFGARQAALEAKDEPVVFNTLASLKHKKTIGPIESAMSNITPPQRSESSGKPAAWVGLTDEQYLEACKIAEDGNYMVAFQRIQQWFKENNT